MECLSVSALGNEPSLYFIFFLSLGLEWLVAGKTLSISSYGWLTVIAFLDFSEDKDTQV